MGTLNPEIKGADVRFSSPVRAVEASNSLSIAAEGVSQLIGVAKKGIVQSAASDAQKLQEQHTAEQKAMLTPEEQEQTTDFGERIQRLKLAAKQNGRAADYRVRAESLLKERINAFPGLASEFRRAMSGVLGFDPTGEQQRQADAAVQERAATAADKLAALDKEAVDKFGFLSGDLASSPEAQEKFLALKNIEQRNKELELRLQNNTLTKSLGSAARTITRVEELEASIDSQRVVIDQSINAFLKNNNIPVTEQELKYGLTPDSYSKAEPQVWEALARKLEEDKSKFIAKQIAYTDDFSPEVVEQIKARASSVYDTAIQALSSKQTLEVYKQQAGFDQAKAVGKVRDSEHYKNLLVLQQTGGNTLPIAQKLSTLLLDEQLSMTSVANQEATEVPIEEVANATSTEVVELANYFKEVSNNMAAEAVSADKREALSFTFSKLATALTDGNAEGVISKDVADSWLGILADESYNDLVKETAKQNPYLSQVMNSYMFDYMRNLKGDALKTVDGILSQYTGTVSKAIKVNTRFRDVVTTEIPLILPKIDDKGALTFELDMEAIKKTDPSILEGSRFYKAPILKKLERLNTSLSADINKVIKATANMDVVSQKEAAELILQEFLQEKETN